MRYLKMLAFLLLPVVMLAMTGCGSSGTATSDPFQKTPPGNSSQDISTSTGNVTLSLATDVPSIDVDNGQALAIATVKSGDTPVPGVTVTFSVLAPTNLAIIENATAVTDSTGTAVTRVTTGHTASTTNVLLQAAVKVGTQTVATTANLQLIRGGGVIMFTDKAGLKPGGQSNLLGVVTAEVLLPSGGVAPGTVYTFAQLLPFKLTDSNQNPRVGAPVTISVYSINSMRPEDVTVDFLVPPVTEPNQTTLTTDSAGQGIFNAEISVLVPNMDNGYNTVDVVFKAVSADPIPVVAYVGGTYIVHTKAKALTQTATTTAFGNAADIVIPISGGLMPYRVSSSDPSRVTVTLLSSGVTALAHIVDTSDWTTPVVITITDASGQTAAVSLTRK